MKSLTLILIICLSTSSCLKPPDETVDYGPEVSPSKVSAQLKIGLGDAPPTAIAEGEYSKSEATRMIRGRDIIDTLSISEIAVTSRNEVSKPDGGTQVQYKYLSSLIEYDLSTNLPQKPKITDSTECIDSETFYAESCLAATSSQKTTLDSNPQVIAEAVMNKVYKPLESQKVTYHNLKTSTALVDPPAAVKNSENCGGITNCKIKVTTVKYDQVIWTSDTSGDKIAVQVKLSQDVPYLSRVLEQCQQGSIPVPQNGEPESEAPRILMTICDTVVNFIKGNP